MAPEQGAPAKGANRPLTLQHRCQELATTMQHATLGLERSQPGLSLVGRGLAQIEAGLDRVEPLARRSVWNIQLRLEFDPDQPAAALNERSKQRGIDLQLIVPRSALELNPLLTTMYPQLLVGPAFIPMILIDGAAVILAGSAADDGAPTAWLSTRADLVEAVSWVWSETRRWSELAVDAGGLTPLSPRQFAIARELGYGHKDAAIARKLNISPRTLSHEIEVVMNVLGATSRFEAALRMRGWQPGAR